MEQIRVWWDEARAARIFGRVGMLPPLPADIHWINWSLDALDNNRRRLLCTPLSLPVMNLLQQAGLDGVRYAERYINTA